MTYCKDIINNPSNTFFWVSPKLQFCYDDRQSFCAKNNLKKGERLFIIGGYILTQKEQGLLYSNMACEAIKISDSFFIGPKKDSDLEKMAQYYIKHSCNPNAGFKGQIFIVSMKKIKKGDKICYDHSMFISSSINKKNQTFNCLCGSKNCRKIITSNDWKNPELQKKYKGFFQFYLQEKIDKLTKK